MRKHYKPGFYPFLFLAVLFSACNKNELSQTKETPVSKRNSVDYKKGDFIFSLANLRKTTTLARSVTNTTAPKFPLTHLYVRFTPTTEAHYKSIEDNNIPTYPYPLATDSLDVSNPDYSTLYTFLPARKLLPNCPYEILDSVCLMDPASPITTLAYNAAGKESRISIEPAKGTTARAVTNSLEYNLPICDPWVEAVSSSDAQQMNIPDCPPCPINEDCPPCEPCTNPPPPPPPPPPPMPADNRTTPFTVTYNNCSMNTDENYPSGRITVEETQWGNGGVAYEGVADIKIEILGPNGQRVVTQTNRYGCFKASGAIRGFRPLFGPRLPVILNVIFKSDRKEIRGMNRTIPDQYTKPLLHIYGNISYSMNNANVSYERHTSNDGDDTKYYVAATVNNALYEFDEYAAKDGILPPPNDIKILVTCFAEAASTPMLNDLKSRNIWDAAAIGNYLNTRVGGLGGILAPSAPDIIFGYKYAGTSSGDFATDKIKETSYHEFSHASHYRKTSTEMWIDNIKYVADYGVIGSGGNPYGNADNPGVERTDLIEMWGYFMGREYAHRRYGPNAHSQIIEFFTNPAGSVFNNSWYAIGENRGDVARVIFDWQHIPAGFLHDLVDNNDYNQNAASVLNESNPVLDTVSGYSIGTIYSYLDASTSSPTILMNKLRNNLPNNTTPINTLTAYDALRSSYGY